jgi:hypothetical protein
VGLAVWRHWSLGPKSGGEASNPKAAAEVELGDELVDEQVD